MKKLLIIVLVSLLILLPTIVALVLNFLPNDFIKAPVNITGTFFEPDGTSHIFDRENNEILTSFFNELEKNSARSDLSLNDIDYDEKFRANLVSKKESRSINLYLSLNGINYFSDEDGSLWEIDQEHISPILNSSFAASIYEKHHMPNLITYSNYTVNPCLSSFKYTTADGSLINGKAGSTTGDLQTYYASNTSVILFSIEPYICNVQAFVNDSLVFEGTLAELKNASISKTDTVHYIIEAVWEQSETPECFGSATYDFYIEYAPIPTFTVSHSYLEAGEFVIIKAENIVEPEKIECSFEGGLITTPKFFKNSDIYYALIPIDMNLKTGDYKLTISCAERTKVTTLHVTERNRSASSSKYSLETPHTQQMLDDMNGLISSVGLNCSDTFLASKTFINYETDYSEIFYFKLGFGRVRSFEAGPDFDMIGIEFTATLDTDISVMNDGIVCASGVDDILGKYVVVDHGYGLKSWYCNISEALFSIGDTVQKGDIIAKTGISAFYNHAGFYLITTVLDVPVSPYIIYEENFTLPD